MNLSENAVRQILEEIEPQSFNREGLKDTPRRVSKMYKEIFGGYALDPVKLLSTTFEDEAHNELVIVRGIEFYSHCEHHMVPFFGQVHVGYIPSKKIVGLSKIARLVDCFARRLQIQERLTTQIANTIVEVLSPEGVIVVCEAEHLCMKMRGIKNPCADTVTSAVRGVFREEADARAEFMSLIRKE